MQGFRATGTFRMGIADQPYAIELVAADEAAAREKVLSTLGSRYGVARRMVHVAKLEPLAGNEAEDPVVRHKLARGA